MSKAIMIQGTMSNAGKSIITAGLCRIFQQDGHRTAPFKSQNMALNSYITEEGLEMGRAQVMQAEACKIKPSVCMNPILLKPTNDTGSQVIVNGEVLGNMSAKEYFGYKKELIPEILKAYRQLEEEYDIIVIEGAGSPAEINLRQNDIVNMGMAKMANSPVLLVGDIDRGGVFAQLVGTIELLEEERALVKGMIINKFRGDASILKPGIEMLEEKTNIPVVGTTPYMDLDIDDEDSLTERFQYKECVKMIDIAVVRLPRISNFTDFNVFERYEQVSLRYVEDIYTLKNPDMIIIPGTKNTMKDLLWLRQSGFEQAIIRAKDRGCVIFGICGGYQMLGESLSDPHFVEEGGKLRGMGLLPIQTCFSDEKTRTRVTGMFSEIKGILNKLTRMPFTGYEIHMGESNGNLEESYDPLTQITGNVMGLNIKKNQDKMDGFCLDNVYGTYIHGIFDEEDIAWTLIECLAFHKGMTMTQLQKMDHQAYKESQYNKLADGLRQFLDMDKIYKILEEGI